MFVAFDVGETLIQYKDVALDWSEHYRPAVSHALFEAKAIADEETLSSAVEILSFYNTRKNPRTFEIERGEVTSKLAKLFGVSPSDFEHHFFSYFQRRTSPMPGASRLLNQLRNAGAYLAVLSDVPYGMPTEKLVEDLGDLAIAFNHIASSCDVGVRKPKRDGLCQLLELSQCSVNHAYYIGNEQKDIEAALSANMRSILLSSSCLIPSYGQTYTITSLTEVARIVL